MGPRGGGKEREMCNANSKGGRDDRKVSSSISRTKRKEFQVEVSHEGGSPALPCPNDKRHNYIH